MNIARTLPETPQGSPDFKFSLKQHSELSFLKGISPIIFDWAVISIFITLSTSFPSWPLYIVAIFVIACRQHALLVVVHDATHFRLSKNSELNDLIANVFSAFPIFFCTAGYRVSHLKHHRYINTDKDPDWARKIHAPEWQFPQTPYQLAGTTLKILATGWYRMLLVFFHFSGVANKTNYATKPGLALMLQKFLFYSSMATAIYLLNAGALFFYYWMVPFLVIFPVIERMRSISEHFALSYKDNFNQTRNILCSHYEAFVFGPHNIRYHLVHHLYPSVPQYNLPAFRECLMEDSEFATKSHENDAYLFGNKSVLKDLLSGRKVEK